MLPQRQERVAFTGAKSHVSQAFSCGQCRCPSCALCCAPTLAPPNAPGDTGEGIIITSDDKVDKYIRLLTHATPIESRFIESLADHLNAEIVLGTVSDIREAVRWLGYTYLYVRMRANPLNYGMTWHELADDPLLGGKREQVPRNALRTATSLRLSHPPLSRPASHHPSQPQAFTRPPSFLHSSSPPCLPGACLCLLVPRFPPYRPSFSKGQRLHCFHSTESAAP